MTRPTLALIGEAGPEAVVPLPSARAFARGGGDVYVEIHNHGAFFGNEQQYASYTADVIMRQLKRGGPLATALRSV